MKILVTGGAGFIGSNLCRKLIKDGYTLRMIDNLATGFYHNIEEIEGEMEFLKYDLRDLDQMKKAVDGVDYILHQAAVPSVPRSVKDPVTTTESNVNGTLHLFMAARDAGVKRVVYASSSSVYGDTPVLPKQEDMKPNPLSPYALSKLADEYLGKIFYNIYGLETVGLRYFNVFGPRQNPDSQYSAVIPKFIKRLNNDKPPIIYGDGLQSRDFTFIDNVIQANIKGMTAEGAAGKIFNIACGERHTVNDLAATIGKLMGKDNKPTHQESRPGDVKHSLADITAAREILGYDPQVTFQEGLRQTVEWYLENAEL